MKMFLYMGFRKNFFQPKGFRVEKKVEKHCSKQTFFQKCTPNQNFPQNINVFILIEFEFCVPSTNLYGYAYPTLRIAAIEKENHSSLIFWVVSCKLILPKVLKSYKSYHNSTNENGTISPTDSSSVA
jgi:hypothetical protein